MAYLGRSCSPHRALPWGEAIGREIAADPSSKLPSASPYRPGTPEKHQHDGFLWAPSRRTTADHTVPSRSTVKGRSTVPRQRRASSPATRRTGPGVDGRHMRNFGPGLAVIIGCATLPVPSVPLFTPYSARGDVALLETKCPTCRSFRDTRYGRLLRCYGGLRAAGSTREKARSWPGPGASPGWGGRPPERRATRFYPQLAVAPNGRIDVRGRTTGRRPTSSSTSATPTPPTVGQTWAHDVKINDGPVNFNYGISFNSDVGTPTTPPRPRTTTRQRCSSLRCPTTDNHHGAGDRRRLRGAWSSPASSCSWSWALRRRDGGVTSAPRARTATVKA